MACADTINLVPIKLHVLLKKNSMAHMVVVVVVVGGGGGGGIHKRTVSNAMQSLKSFYSNSDISLRCAKLENSMGAGYHYDLSCDQVVR